MILRMPTEKELGPLSELCLRSKGFWGYDEAFLKACRAELTLSLNELEHDHLIVADQDGIFLGVAHLVVKGDQATLEKLFIDPSAIGRGVGKRLFDWATNTARTLKAASLSINSDPGAEAFYQKMGAKTVQHVTSGSIPGRTLPQMLFQL